MVEWVSRHGLVTRLGVDWRVCQRFRGVDGYYKPLCSQDTRITSSRSSNRSTIISHHHRMPSARQDTQFQSRPSLRLPKPPGLKGSCYTLPDGPADFCCSDISHFLGSPPAGPTLIPSCPPWMPGTTKDFPSPRSACPKKSSSRQRPFLLLLSVSLANLAQTATSSTTS